MIDLGELIFLLQDQYIGTMVRCKKARSMFAMRACRKSVMFGHSLTMRQMTLVARHMGEIDHPWVSPARSRERGEGFFLTVDRLGVIELSSWSTYDETFGEPRSDRDGPRW